MCFATSRLDAFLTAKGRRAEEEWDAGGILFLTMSRNTFGGIRRPSFNVDEIVGKLRRINRNYGVKIWISVVSGVALLPAGAFLITCMVWLFDFSFGEQIAFWHAYWMTLLIATPLMFLVALSVRGSVLEDHMPEADGFFARRMVGRIAVFLLIIEFATIGPRLMIHAFRQWRRRSAVGRVNVKRVAEAVVVLLVTDQGVNPVQLVNEKDAEGTLTNILGFLMLHDLADVAKTGDRVWLRSTGREMMVGK